MSDNKRILNWEDFDQIMASIHGDIARLGLGKTFGAIIGLSRGGLIPATVLSHKMSLPLIPMMVQLRDGDGHIDPIDEIARVTAMLDNTKRAIIVDDINDSGATLKLITENWPKGHRRPIVAVMCERASSPFAADVVGFTENTEKWIMFSWEY